MSMISVQILAAVLSAIAGGILPLLKELVRELRKNNKGEEFFKTDFGRGLLQFLKLDRPVDTPETLFKDLSENFHQDGQYRRANSGVHERSRVVGSQARVP